MDLKQNLDVLPSSKVVKSVDELPQMERIDVNLIDVEKIRNGLPAICQCSCPNECFSLDFIMETLDNFLDEETTWGLLHQIFALLRSFGKGKRVFHLLEVPEEMSNVCIHKDGLIHWSWSDDDIRTLSSRPLSHITDKVALQKIGIFIYKAVDFSLKEDEERILSKSLENFFEFIIFGKVDNEKSFAKFESSVSPLLDFVLEKCRKRILFTLAEFHYRSMCASLFRDAYILTRNTDDLRQSDKLEDQPDNHSEDLVRNQSFETDIDSEIVTETEVEDVSWSTKYNQVVAEIKAQNVQLKNSASEISQ